MNWDRMKTDRPKAEDHRAGILHGEERDGNRQDQGKDERGLRHAWLLSAGTAPDQSTLAQGFGARQVKADAAHGALPAPPAMHRRPFRSGVFGLTPSERVLRSRMAAYVLHSRYDSRELTKPARAPFESKFERDVDPDGVLPLEERPRRAEMARKAHYTRLALANS